MSQYGTILGFVSTPDGDPIEGATALIVTGPAHADIAAITDERRLFELSDLDPGFYVIRISADGCEPVREGVQVRGGQVSRIYVVLQSNVEDEIE